MCKIKFEVKDRVINRIGNFVNTVGDNSDYEAEFLFDSEWDGHIKTARFIQSGKYVEQILENDKCLIPVEVLKHGYLKVGVFTSEMTTTQCEVFIRPSIKQDNGVTAEPTPDVYSQIIRMIENMEASGVTDEQIEKAVTKYLSEHPIETLTEADVQRIVAEYVAAHKEEFKGDKGDKGNPGEKGDPGVNGKDGVTPNLTIGTVETLEAGSNATATITGDRENPVLNLGIPKGVDGQGGSENDETHYKYMYNDIRVIPDKYNTGIPNNVELETGSCIIDLNGAEYKNLTGQIEFNNKDFTSDNISEIKNGWGYVGEGLKFIFNNCKFRKYRQPYDAKNVNIEFNNCSFMMSTTAFNSIFNKCFFGNFDNTVDGDACNPKMNCILNDCYIANTVVKTDAQGEDHIDGSQVLNGDNVEFNNCRWECPDINYTYKQGQVSYALYLQNSTNCRVNNCHINGGGNYSISCTSEEGNIIKNTFIGECFTSNAFYPTHKATIKNVDLFNSLYVSSVWKDENNYLHFLVTNDTKIDREITVLTNVGISKFVIPRTYTINEYDVDTKNFDDLPIDVEKIIESNVDYAVFFENGRQIRFVNFTDFAVVRNNVDILDISARYDDTEIRGEISNLKTYIDNQIGGVLNGSY